MTEVFRWRRPAQGLPFTGERFTSETSGQIEFEHLHRYFVAREISRGKDVLDIASGEGYGSALIAQLARSVVGVDVDAEAAAHAARAYAGTNLAFVRGDARALPFRAAGFDIVVSFETIEHLYEQEQFVAEVRRVLRPDGVFIVSTPDREVYSAAGAPPNPFHLKELDLGEFTELLRRHFPFVQCLLQKCILGSVLLPKDDPAAAGIMSFERHGDDFKSTRGLPDATYALGFASAQPVRLPGATMYFESSSPGLYIDEARRRAGSEQQLAGLEADNRRLEELFATARSENERLEALLATARSEIARLEQHAGGLRAENRRLQGLFDTALSENQRLEPLFATARSENERLEALFATARSENQRLEGLLAELRTENARLQGLFDTALAENQRLEPLFTLARSENERLEALLGEMRAENERLRAIIGDTSPAGDS